MIKKKFVTRLQNYKAPPFSANSVYLKFILNPKCTLVSAKIFFSTKNTQADLVLDGKEIELRSVKINNIPVDLNLLEIDDEKLRVPKGLITTKDFLWEAEAKISPKTNSSLEGLYLSSDIYSTQCEAEGFRKITYFLDRPDVMSTYSVRVESKLPVLLSNGNLVKSGPGFAEWEDPWPKPSYLFALVAGNLMSFDDTFTTKSGRKIELKIYVKEKDLNKCSFAMTALKRAMKWDEEEYEREYDLDLFMIVAVDDFNMGAMENKGLNIFNSKYILANSETATDKDYDFIERIVAHEYFHNWTGNRITCRDWFQLCLKEGLTVFREQQFSEASYSSPVKRIDDVLKLKKSQFREDDGPLAHPVRPNEYLEINNFYTSTVYEKGAEIVRMLQLLVGNKNYKKSVQKFFKKFDGQACTVEDWLGVFEKTLKLDLKQFAYWYYKKGRPEVIVEESFREGVYSIKLSQKLLANSKTVRSKPLVIPIKIGLLDIDGNEILQSHTILLTKKVETFSYEKFEKKPIPSLLRCFSAPITLRAKLPQDELLTLAEYDHDLFNRWSAIQQLSLNSLEENISSQIPICSKLTSVIVKQLRAPTLEPCFKALLISPPNEESIITHLATKKFIIEPDSIHRAMQAFKKAIAIKASLFLKEIFEKAHITNEYAPDPSQSGNRALRLKVLDLLCYLDSSDQTAKELFERATNMTEKLGALIILIRHNKITDELDEFFNLWKKDRNVLDKWFAAQAINTGPESAVATIQTLTEHPSFSINNPNRFNSVIGSFAFGNLCGFHKRDGKGYDIVTRWLIKLDGINPQTTARICTVFDNWKIYDDNRQKKIKRSLESLININDLSRNTFEIVDKILNY